MAFRNVFTRKGLKPSKAPTGERFFIKQGWTYKEGELVFVDKDIIPVYEKIQAQKETTDLHSIIERYEDEGESALNKVQGMYIDAVDLPRNYAELYDSVSKANDVFDALPVKIKDQFGNSPARFWKNYGKETFDAIINEYRSDTLSKYGMNDTQPVKTAEQVSAEIPVESVVKEGENNE